MTDRKVDVSTKLCYTFTRMSGVRNMLMVKNKIKKRSRLTHETIKNIIKTKQVFYTDAVVQALFNMGYTSYNISQRPHDIEVLVRLLRLPAIKEEDETEH